MVAQPWVERDIPMMRGQTLPRQLVVFGRGSFDNIPRRNAESRCAFLRPERSEIAKHGRETLRVIGSPLLRRVVVQVAECPEVEQFVTHGTLPSFTLRIERSPMHRHQCHVVFLLAMIPGKGCKFV